MHSAVSIRPPAVAGEFYPGDPGGLRRTVENLLSRVHARPVPAFGAIVPHAGYACSGACAAEVYASVAIPGTVVLLGPNHYRRGRAAGWAAVWPAGAFATPLGDVPVDGAFAAALLADGGDVVVDFEAHGEDHALEVQLPFLLVRAAPHAVTIVPILLRDDDWARCARLASVLTALARERGPANVLLVASSDMTHFEPALTALYRDAAALAAIRRLDGARLLRVCAECDISMCGAAGAAVVLEAARELGAHQADVVAHTHSGFATGDHSSVVSYAGVVIR